MSLRTGIWMFPDRPAPELVELIVAAERAGLDEFWIGDEGPAREPFTVLAAAAAVTHAITLGVGITNPYVRAPALAITTALTIHELSHGRCILGVGAGGQLSLAPMKLEATSPLAHIDAFITTARSVSAGVPGPGYIPTDIAISEADISPPLPVFVGARGPKLNSLASKVADGAFVAGLPPILYESVIGWARSARPIDIALYPGVAFTDEALERQRPHQIWGLRDTPDEVRIRFGLDHEEVTAAAEALASGEESPARALITDDMLPHLMLTGTPELVGGRLADLVREHRPTSIGLALTVAEPALDLAASVEAFAVMRRRLSEGVGDGINTARQET